MRAIAAAALSCLVGCGLILGIDDRAVDDRAKVQTVDDGGARSDAAGPVTDGDVAPRLDAAPGPFCASLSPAPTFCADFEKGEPGDSWDDVLIQGAGSFALVQDPARGSVLAMNLPSSGTNGACLVRLLPGKKSKVTLDFDLRLAKRGGGPDSLDLVRIGDAEKSETNIALELHQDLALAVDEDLENGDSKVTELGATLGTQWTHVAIAYDVATDAEMRTSLSGAPLKTVRTGPTAFQRSTLELQVGDCGAGKSVDWQILYDNVTITTQ